jgi:hypothetical protein
MDRNRLRSSPVLEPEVLPPDDTHPDPVVDLIVHYMDRAFSIGGFRFGYDGIVGLIPGIGDAIGGIASAVILFRAAQAGVPKSALLRMSGNVVIDVALGAIPFLGDIFDFAFKANTINARIYKNALLGRHKQSSDYVFLTIFGLVILAIIALPFLVIAWAIQFSQHLM